MKTSTTNPSLGMKTINKNTLAVNSTSGTTMITNSNQYIYFTISHSMESFKSYERIKLRFRQTNSSEANVNVYVTNPSYILSSTSFKTKVVKVGLAYYREVDLTNYLLGKDQESISFGLVSDSAVSFYTTEAQSGFKPELVVEYIEDNPFIKRQKCLEGATSSKDQYSVNVRNGEMRYGINLLNIVNRYLPFNLSLNFNTKKLTSNSITSSIKTNMPLGWRLNFQQYIYANTNGYVYVDGMGNEHQFVLSETGMANLYFDTSGSYLILRVDSTSPERYIITVDNFEQMYFDANGYLVKITKQVSNTKTYSFLLGYSTDNKLTSITNDGDIVTITYNTSTIVITHSSTSEIITLTFDSNNLLTKVKGIDDIETSFEYVNQGALTRAIQLLGNQVISGIQTLNKRVEFDYYTQAKRVKGIKEYSLNSGTKVIDNSYEIEYLGGSSKISSHPYSEYVKNAGSLFFLYTFNENGELQEVDEIKNDEAIFSQIIIGERDREKVFKNSGVPIAYKNTTFNLTSDGVITNFVNSQYNKDTFIVINYQANVSYLTIENPKISIQIIDSNDEVLGEKELNYLKKGDQRLVIPFKQEIGSGNSVDDDDLTLRLKIIYNEITADITINNIEVFAGTCGERSVYTNVNTGNESINVDSQTYYKWDKVNLTYTYNETTTTLNNVVLTYNDLVKNKDSLIHSANNQESQVIVFYNDGKNMLCGVTDVKYNTTRQIDLIALYGTSDEHNVNYQMINYVGASSGYDIQNINHFYSKKYKNSNRKKITKSDKYRKVISESDEHGILKTYTYDTNGNLIEQSISNTNSAYTDENKSLVMNYEYTNGLVTKEKQYLGSNTIGNRYTYDLLGRVTSVGDINNTTLGLVSNTYNPNLSKVVLPITTSTNDTNNLTYEGEYLKTLSQNNGVNVTFNYDYRGNITSINIGGSNYCTITHTYSSSGNKEVITYGNGEKYRNTYDIYGRLIKIEKYINSAYSIIKEINYTDCYENNTSLAKLKNITTNFNSANYLEDINYMYSSDGILESTTKSYSSEVSNENFKIEEKSFSEANTDIHQAMQVKSKTIKLYNDTEKTYYDFITEKTSYAKIFSPATYADEVYKEIVFADDNNRITENLFNEKLNRAKIQEVIMNNYLYRHDYTFYDAGSNTSNFIYKDNFKFYKLSSSTTTNHETTYTYTDRGLINSVNNDDNLTTYHYDHQNRLIREDIQKFNKTYVYTYDTRGNLISKKTYAYTTVSTSSLPQSPQSEITYTYNEKNQLTSYGGKTIEYDANGYPTKINGNSLMWENGRLNNYKSTQFYYGADNQRIHKLNSTSGSINFLNDNESLFRERRTDGKTIEYIRGSQGIIGFRYKGSVFYYRRNILGDVVSIYYNGSIVANYVYDAWGNHRVYDASGYQNHSSTFVGNVNPIRYRGYYYDVETQLYWVSSRYYSPELCRWISPDSIEYLDPQSINGLNLYAYCGNNPVNNVDPSGHFAITTFLICLGVGALVGGTLGGITAYSEGQDILTGVLTGALLGAAVGAVVGIGGAALSGAVSSALGKTATDLISVAFYGGEFGSWEDYAIAFAFGGLTGSLGSVTGKFAGLAKAGKFAADVALRPAANQLVKMGTRGNTFNRDKYLYDVITRTVTYGGSNSIMKSNMFGLNLKVDLGKCFYRSTFRSLYSYI